MKKDFFSCYVAIPVSGPQIQHGCDVLNSAFNESHPSNVLHIHLVGDGKAGKSVASRWISELFAVACTDSLTEGIKMDFSVSQQRTISTDVERGRTRGVQTTTLRFHDQKYEYDEARKEYIAAPPKHYVIMIHDYGGQEEFLSNHANFLATDNSVYLIVVPLVQVGESIKEKRLRSITEMMERYLFWCRFVFSVIRREQAFPVISMVGHDELAMRDRNPKLAFR
jgi:hypothetical protein